MYWTDADYEEKRLRAERYWENFYNDKIDKLKVMTAKQKKEIDSLRGCLQKKTAVIKSYESLLRENSDEIAVGWVKDGDEWMPVCIRVDIIQKK